MPRRAPPARRAEILLATATAAIDVLEGDPAEPVLLNYAGVALYELWSLDAAQALFTRRAAARPERCRTCGATSPSASAASAARRPPQSARCVASARASCAARRRVAERARPARGMTLSLCMIVRDEEEMLPRCLGGRGARRRRDRDRRHRLSGPHDRDRALVRGARDRARVDGLVLGRPQRLLRRGDRRLAALPRRRRGAGRRRRRATARADRPDLARGLLPRGDELHGQEDSGTAVTLQRAADVPQPAPTTASPAACTSRSASTCRRTCPSGSTTPTSGSSTTAISAPCATRRRSRAATSSCCSRRRPRAHPTPFLHFNLGSEYFAAATAPRALREFEQAWAMSRATGEDRSLRVHPDPGRAPGQGAARLRSRRRTRSSSPRTGLELFPGYTDLVYEQATPRSRSAASRTRSAYFERVHRDGRRARAVYGAASAAARTCRGSRSPRSTCAAVSVEGALELLRWCARAPPRVLRADPALRDGAAARGHRAPRRSSPRSSGCVPSVTPTVRFMLGHGAVRVRRGAGRREPVPAVCSSASRTAARRASHSARRSSTSAATPEAAPRPRRSTEAAPAAALAARSELFGTILAGDLDGARSGARSGPGAPACPRPSWRCSRAGWTPARAWRTRHGSRRSPCRCWRRCSSRCSACRTSRASRRCSRSWSSTELAPREQRELLAQSTCAAASCARPHASGWRSSESARTPGRMLGLAHVALANGQPQARWHVRRAGARARSRLRGSAARILRRRSDDREVAGGSVDERMEPRTRSS